MHIVFYSKPDCPLCDRGLPVVLDAAARRGLDVRRVDIERSDPATFQRHRFRIPVVCLATRAGERELAWGRLSRRAIEDGLDARIGEDRSRKEGGGRV